MTAEIAELRRHDKADALLFATLAAGAPYSQETTDQVQEILESLRGGAKDSTSYLMDPNAQTDWGALRGLNQQGILATQKVHVESANGH